MSKDPTSVLREIRARIASIAAPGPGRARVAFAVVLALLILVLGAVETWRAVFPPTDIAAGRPIRLSSQYPGFKPGFVDGQATDIVLHTRLEDMPWAEVDFAAPVTVSSVVVRNRSDYGLERATPMVIEVSNDGSKWTEVARTTRIFHTWRAQFAPVSARLLRVKVLKKTYLHLERLSVY